MKINTISSSPISDVLNNCTIQGLLFTLLVLHALLLPLPAHCGDSWNDTITPEITLEAIKIFRENPTGSDARGALSLVVNFAKTSDDVTVTLAPEYLPWRQGSLEKSIEGIFLGAFVAGNVEYQLVHQIKENRPLEGIRLMLYSYKMLKYRNKIDTIGNFEEWLELDSRELLQHRLNL